MNLARFITGHINWPTARWFGCLSTALINCSRAKLFVVASGYWPLEIGRVVGYFLLGHFLACRHIKLYAHTHTPQAFAVASFANRPVDKLRSYGINQLVLAGAFPIPIPLQIPLRPPDSCSSSLRHRSGNSSEKLCPPAVRANVSQ